MGNGRRRLRIAVDVMGGDYAPQETVKGAVLAGREYRDSLEILLVGQPGVVEGELAKHDASGLPLRIVAAPDAIPDGGHAAFAMHRRPSSSVAIATQLVRDGKADAVVGVGHTGACLIAASWYLGQMPGIDRPAAGVAFPIAPNTFIIDMGLNPDARPRQLLQFAVLGTVYVRAILGIPTPTVALLSNGAEEGKGTKQVREAYELLKRSGLNFVGNVEGIDVPLGKANVVVCDGFVGNVVGKFLEGASAALLQRLDGLVGEDGGPGLSRFRAELAAMTDLTTTQHLVLLGVNGVFVPGHGRAKGPAIEHAIETAKVAVEHDLVGKLRAELEKLRDLLAVDTER